MDTEERVRAVGAQWLGRSYIGVKTFKNQFGVYPRTCLEVLLLTSLELKALLQTLWWLKTYPTEQDIQNRHASPSYFRKKLWETLHTLNDVLPPLPFDLRFALNAAPQSLANSFSFILDTTTIKTFKPTLEHGDFERFGKLYWNQHKRTFGVKLEIAVAMQRRPVPIFSSVAPAGIHDLAMARRPGDVFSRLRPGERGLGDPGYLGAPDKIYAPPRRNMKSYVASVDKVELTLQRRVEMLNSKLKTFKCLGTVYRKGAVRAFSDLAVIGMVVPKLLGLDLLFNQEYSGQIHMTGPKKVDALSLPRRSTRRSYKRGGVTFIQTPVGKPARPKKIRLPPIPIRRIH